MSAVGKHRASHGYSEIAVNVPSPNEIVQLRNKASHTDHRLTLIHPEWVPP